MQSSAQDGVASLPNWYREFIVRRYGLRSMRLLDRVGAHHDSDIVKYGHKYANARMRKKMRRLKLSFWLIRMPIGLGLWLYRVAPKQLRNLYWK